MGQSSQKFGQLSVKFGQLSERSLDRLLSYLSAAHPQKTADAVEATTRGVVKADAVRKWFARASRPSFEAFCALIAAYGAELVAAVLGEAPASIAAAAAMEKRARYQARVAALEAEFKPFGPVGERS